MTDYVIVRINENLIPEFQINYNSNSKIAVKNKLSAWSEIKNPTNDKLILIVCASLVLSTKVKIPSKSDEIIRQSLPFTLEEELADSIELSHFSYQGYKDEYFLVSVVNKEIIDKIMLQLKECQHTCYGIFSEIYSIPKKANYLSIVQCEDYSIIRHMHTGTTVTKEVAPIYVKTANESKTRCYSNNQNTFIEGAENILGSIKDLQAQTLISQIESSNAVNILQGIYSSSDEGKPKKRPLGKLVLLGLMLISSWVIINSYQVWKLSEEITGLKTKQKSLLNTLIPNASQTEKNDPYSAVLSRLKIKTNSSLIKNKKGVIHALSYVGESLLEQSSVTIKSLRYRGNKLEIEITADNVNELNAFQKKLESIAFTMRVKTGTRDASENKVTSVITMEQI